MQKTESLLNIKITKSDVNAVYICAAAPFLPYYLTSAVLIALTLFIIVSGRIRTHIFRHSGSVFLPAFLVLTLTTGIIYKNLLGCVSSFAFFCIIIIALYLRTVMRKEIFEKALDIACVAGGICALVCAAEKLINFKSASYRCFGDFFSDIFTSFYFNPNYLGSLMAAVIIICAYKVILKKGDKKVYYAAAVLCLTAVYFSGSLFALVEIFIGLSFLLLLAKKHRLLAALLITAAFGATMVLLVPELLPRLAEATVTGNNRVMIWSLAIKSIPKSVIFGRGFFGYYVISNATPGAYITTHAHNIVIEFLLSFGIVGSGLFITFFVFFFKRAAILQTYLKRKSMLTLTFAVTAAVLVHSMVDLTFLWVQTALLYSVIFAGIGCDEHTFAVIKSKYKKANI